MRVSLNQLGAAVLALVVGGGVNAAEDQSVSRQIIDTEGKVVLQKLQQDLTKAAPPAAISAAPAGAAEVKAPARAPQTIALYGVDGRAAGGTMSLRSYVKWGDQIYPARVGAKWRGFTVASISETGTTFAKGKVKVFAPLAEDDSAVLLDTLREPAPGALARPAGPLPAQTGAGAPGGPLGQQPTMPMMPPAPQVPLPSAPVGGPASIAQR